jgi:hypothetical protein
MAVTCVPESPTFPTFFMTPNAELTDSPKRSFGESSDRRERG